MAQLKVFTAFSGYDSQMMALRRAGIDCDLVGWSEIDKYAIKAHNAVFPEYAGRNFGDITMIDWKQVPNFDLFTYSSPCQDFSNAGLMKGGEEGSGTRSALLWECKRAILAKHPKYLLFENVPTLVSEKFIKTFNQWEQTLAEMGYTNYRKVINAKDYVPQSRARVFMVSIRDEEQFFMFPERTSTTTISSILENDEEVDERYYLTEEHVKALEMRGTNTNTPQLEFHE